MLKEYFISCEQQFPEQRSELRRISLVLRRNGVENMPQLCQIYKQTPERLLEIRSIGEKSVQLIGEMCRLYQKMVTYEENG